MGNRATRTKYVLYDVCHVCGAEKTKPCFNPKTKALKTFKHQDRPKLYGADWRVGDSWWAQLVYRLMIANRITPAELGRRMYVSRTHIYRLLADEVRPMSSRSAMQIFNLLGYTINYTVTLDLERRDPENPRPARAMRRRVLLDGQEFSIERKTE